jgi:hypothetical protein
MRAFTNPFYFRELAIKAPFCDREEELSKLISYAKGKANVVLYSPRRYGKTSLVRRVQNRLAEEGALVIFADFFGITSIDDMAARLAKAVFEVAKPEKSLFEKTIGVIKTFRPVLKPDETGGIALSVEPASSGKAGAEVLEDTVSSLREFIESSERLVHIALDEFQEITQLKDAPKIEGIMRSHIQRFDAACFFIGSRRRLLLSMFNDRRRPFFQSAINYELKILPHDDLVKFITDLFSSAGKFCDISKSEIISKKVSQHPYYSQKFAFFVYETSDESVQDEDIAEAFEMLLESERPFYEAIIQGLTPQQIALLRAIARESSPSIFSIDYMKRHGLGSTGGMQGALKKLTLLDLIEQDSNKSWKVVDPVFNIWLKK